MYGFQSAIKCCAMSISEGQSIDVLCSDCGGPQLQGLRGLSGQKRGWDLGLEVR